LRFSRLWLWRMPYSGTWHCIALVRTDVSEERISTIRLERFSVLRTLPATSNWRSSETAVLTKTTQRNIPEDILHSHRRENLKSYLVKLLYQAVCPDIQTPYHSKRNIWTPKNRTSEQEIYWPEQKLLSLLKTYRCRNWITEWSWAHLQRPPVVQPLRSFPVYYSGRRSITVFITALHLSPS
jgi:hypothetical protein